MLLYFLFFAICVGDIGYFSGPGRKTIVTKQDIDRDEQLCHLRGIISFNNRNNEFVAIKKIAKDFTHKKEIIKNGFAFITDTNIVNEGIVLPHINSKQHKTNKSIIITLVAAFECDEHYYLVEEFTHGNITLKEFVTKKKSHEYITNGSIQLKNYRKCLKSILWQLAQTLGIALNNTDAKMREFLNIPINHSNS